MGLWGSKQQKNVSVTNPEPISQVFVTDDALKNVIKTVEEENSPKKDSKKTSSEKVESGLSADLYDKRLMEYENNLIRGFNTASREVEELFRQRYKTLPVCADFQKKVSECYTTNVSAPLKCVDIAQEFVKCVEKERQSKFGLPPTNLKTTSKLNGA